MIQPAEIPTMLSQIAEKMRGSELDANDWIQLEFRLTDTIEVLGKLARPQPSNDKPPRPRPRGDENAGLARKSKKHKRGLFVALTVSKVQRVFCRYLVASSILCVNGTGVAWRSEFWTSAREFQLQT